MIAGHQMQKPLQVQIKRSVCLRKLQQRPYPVLGVGLCFGLGLVSIAAVRRHVVRCLDLLGWGGPRQRWGRPMRGRVTAVCVELRLASCAVARSCVGPHTPSTVSGPVAPLSEQSFYTCNRLGTSFSMLTDRWPCPKPFQVSSGAWPGTEEGWGRAGARHWRWQCSRSRPTAKTQRWSQTWRPWLHLSNRSFC